MCVGDREGSEADTGLKSSVWQPWLREKGNADKVLRRSIFAFYQEEPKGGLLPKIKAQRGWGGTWEGCSEWRGHMYTYGHIYNNWQILKFH